MKLAKRLITFSLAAALSLSLAACGGGLRRQHSRPRHYPTCRLLLRHGAHQADDGHLPLC